MSDDHPRLTDAEMAHALSCSQDLCERFAKCYRLALHTRNCLIREALMRRWTHARISTVARISLGLVGQKAMALNQERKRQREAQASS